MSLPPLPLSADVLVPIGVGVANFLALMALGKALAPRNPMAARVRDHARRRSELRASLLKAPKLRRPRPINLARRVVEGLNLHRGGDARKIAAALARAGWRSRDAIMLFLGLRLASPLVLGLVGYLLGPALAPKLGPASPLLTLLGGLAAGFFLPGVLLRNAVQKREQKIHRGLPDALDLFVICAEAGLSLDAAIARVSREIGASAPELADELGLTAIELGFLPDRREALHNLARRVDTPQLRGLVNTLVQTEKYGTPLAQSLRVLAAEFREARVLKAEEKAARLPATLTVPMIIFILPPLLVVLIGPAIVQVLATLH